MYTTCQHVNDTPLSTSMAPPTPTTYLATLALLTEKTSVAFVPTFNSCTLGGTWHRRRGRARGRPQSSPDVRRPGDHVPSMASSRTASGARSDDEDQVRSNSTTLLSKWQPRDEATTSTRSPDKTLIHAGLETRPTLPDETRQHDSGGTPSSQEPIGFAHDVVPGGQGQLPQQQGQQPARDVLAAVQHQLSRNDIVGAVSALASAVEAAAASGTKTRRSNDHRRAAELTASSLRSAATAILTACSKTTGCSSEAAYVITALLPAAGLEASRGDWLTAIEACVGIGGPEQAIFNLHDMRTRGMDIDKLAYTAAIRACVRYGSSGRAVFLLRDASRRGVPLLPADVVSTMREAMKRGATGCKTALALYTGFLNIAVGQTRLRPALDARRDAATPCSGPYNRRKNDDDNDDDKERGHPLGQELQLYRLSEIAPGWQEVCQAALEVCSRGRQWEQALEVLNVLRAGGGGSALSQEAYDAAIHVCGLGGAWDMVMLLVAEMSSDEVVISPAAFQTALKACGATGNWTWAKSLLISMHTEGGMSLKASHYLDALRACGRVIDKPGGRQAQKAAVTALAMLQDMRENGWLTGRQGEAAYTNAMEACVLAEDAWSALALLDCAEDDAVRRSMELRTAGMQACSGAGEWRAALSILEDAQREGLRPSGEAYIAAMAACARGGVVDLTLELLRKILAEHAGDEAIITAAYHGAISACAECGNWEGATDLLEQMQQDSMAVVTSEEYNAVILACCRAQKTFAALSLLGDMSVAAKQCSSSTKGRQRAIRPDESSYIHVMRAFGRERRWQTVVDLHLSMQEEAGLRPSVSSYNVVVESLAKAGEWQRALSMLEEMKRGGIRPTEYTYNRCMAACEKSGEWTKTLALMEDMKKQKDLIPDSYSCSTAMMACSKAARLDDVLRILQDMRHSPRDGPNLVNYNIAIGACARARDWPRVFEELDNMERENIRPEENTFLVSLDICGRSGNLPTALKLLTRMRACNVDPTVVTYGSIVAAACGAGDTGTATRLLDEMDSAGIVPNEVTYVIAALACREGANADAAVELLRRRNKQGLEPDPLCFSFAVQACSKAGDLERGLRLIASMRTAGLEPDTSFYTGVIAGICSEYCVPAPEKHELLQGNDLKTDNENTL